MSLLENSEHTEDEHSEDDHDDHHDDEHHEDEHEHEDEHDHHDHGEFDPHTWLDPVLAQEMASLILEQVVAVNPNNEDQYNQNYDLLIAELSELDDNYASTLSSCTKKQAVSSHDAFSYLEERYEFELLAISGLSPQSQPSSQKIQELINLSNQENITHILEEDFADQSFSNVIKDQAGLDTLSINTLESTPEPGQDYISVMNSNLESFRQAFNCNN